MTIETKFKPGQEVWVMKNNKPTKLFVNTIKIFAYLDFNKNVTYSETYFCSNGSNGGEYIEKEIYATKEDLKNSLFG